VDAGLRRTQTPRPGRPGALRRTGPARALGLASLRPHYFDSPNAPKGDTRPDSSQAALAEFQKPAASTVFSVTL
jgi:hypothetical protein